MGNVSTFSEFDEYIISARQYFRLHASQKQKEIGEIFNLYFDFLRSIGKLKTPVEWDNSREEYAIKVLTKSMQSILGMYYLSESGFYDLALSLKRNFTELLLVAIAIGYDNKSFIDWKHNRDNFKDAHIVASRIKKISSIPDTEKHLLPILLKYWDESSQLHSHQVTKKSIEEGLRMKNGNISLGSNVVKEEVQEKKLNTLRNMALNVITILIGIFDYDKTIEPVKEKYPESEILIAKYNYYQEPKFKLEATI